MQNKTLQNSLLVLLGLGIGVLGFYLVSRAQVAPDSDSVNAYLTVPGTVSIADDGVDFNTTLTPGVIDTSQLNTLTVASNNATGYNVTTSLSDLSSAAGRLCADSTPDDGACDASGNLFDADNGSGTTGSYLSVTSQANAGSPLLTHPSATFVNTETNLGDSAITVYATTSGRNNEEDFQVLYDAFTDFTSTIPDSYEGDITFVITAQ